MAELREWRCGSCGQSASEPGEKPPEVECLNCFESDWVAAKDLGEPEPEPGS